MEQLTSDAPRRTALYPRLRPMREHNIFTIYRRSWSHTILFAVDHIVNARVTHA